jgi:hypothetical protein
MKRIAGAGICWAENGKRKSNALNGADVRGNAAESLCPAANCGEMEKP